ncbi:MAG: hypothetical protein J0M12_08860 [Deltaproteobacteria bacterium]|nr:hypothetical protein [Deltaproteobacteria bacterium]
MGSLAKIGIAAGRIVPVAEIPGHSAAPSLSEFSRSCLSRFGFARIADRVCDGAPLNVRDVETLLSKASLPVLMKLVEIKRCSEGYAAPLPLVLLPLASWSARYDSTKILELSEGLLRGIRHKHLRVVIDELDYSKLDGELFSVLREISSCRPGVTLVGPSVDDVVSWVVSATQNERGLKKFEALLHRLRDAGLGRLMPTSMVDVLKTVHEAGFPASLVTNVSEFSSPLELAKELLRVNEIAQGQPIDVWVPGYQISRASSSLISRSALNFQLLRVLAVGSLCLDAVPHRRASTRYFSVDALQFARYCGANDYGFGAVNELTARSMQLEKLDRLKRAVRSTGIGTPASSAMPCYFPEA